MKPPLKARNKLFPGKSITKIIHLGSGKMGNVYKIDFDNEESICVKRLSKNHYTKSQDSNGWKCAYEHFDFNFQSYEDSKYFYFTTPYFKGKLLHFAIRYNLKSRFEIIQNLIKATKNLHHIGLIHRDLKCDNIIVNKNQVYIIDFGRSVNVFNFSTSNTFSLIKNLHPFEQKIIPANIKRFFQPYTAPEYFKRHKYNGSTAGFRSDYYSIAQIFRFLIPEYSYLADEVINTEGPDRNHAFKNFLNALDTILKQNESNPDFNKPDKMYPDIVILYKKIIFFIRQILNRIFNLLYQPTTPEFTKQKQFAIGYNEHPNISSGFFKFEQQNSDKHLVTCSPTSHLTKEGI